MEGKSQRGEVSTAEADQWEACVKEMGRGVDQGGGAFLKLKVVFFKKTKNKLRARTN